MSDVTRILSAIEQGDPKATEQLLPLVYDELRRLASRRLAHESPGQTLQATALVHEAYVRLVQGNPEQNWDNRRHFFAAAAEAMRRILVEQARRKRGLRHGGGRQQKLLNESQITVPGPSAAVLAVEDALERFERLDPQKATLVKLRYFVGLTIPQAADALGISAATADRYWAYARAWLHSRINRTEDEQQK
jgi:RNA polymerase sigma factor (TIGR02999 family)